MKVLARTLMLLALALTIAVPLSAKDKKPKTPKSLDPSAAILKRLEKAQLTADQTAKIKELCQKQGEKLQAADKKVNLTPEQRKARGEATKKAQAEGKKGKDLQAAVDAAAKLTEEQQAALKAVQEIRRAMLQEATGLLTPEQKSQAGIQGGHKKPGKKK